MANPNLQVLRWLTSHPGQPVPYLTFYGRFHIVGLEVPGGSGCGQWGTLPACPAQDGEKEE